MTAASVAIQGRDGRGARMMIPTKDVRIENGSVLGDDERRED
jgi:hypothetical protein